MILYNPDAFLDLPRFGIGIPALDERKTRILEELGADAALEERRGEWLIEGYEDMFGLEDILLAHSEEYARGFFDERAGQRIRDAFELTLSDGSPNRWEPESAKSPLRDMVPRLCRSAAGVYRAGRIGLDCGFCQFLGGGAHHGHRDFGHGFCAFNDLAAAILKLRGEGRIERAWVIDVDAHKGDGTAALFAEDSRVLTLSIHMARGWPLDGSFSSGHPSYTPSDFDIPIESGEEDVYLKRLEAGLEALARDAPADFAVVVAGVDPWEGDALPSTAALRLNLDQLFRRDRMVWDFLDSEGIPSAWLTAGGYGEGAWRVHFQFLSWVLRRRTGLTEGLPATNQR